MPIIDHPARDPDSGAPKWDMKMPFWVMLAAAMTTGGAYFGQKEATSVALTEIKGDLNAVKSTMARIETDRYTGADARRDLAWRDERTVEMVKRLAELEIDMRRKR